MSVKLGTCLQHLWHPGVSWNTPLTGRTPGLALITKIKPKSYKTKTLKYLQWNNKYVLPVTGKRRLTNSHYLWDFFHYFLDLLTQNLIPYSLPYINITFCAQLNSSQWWSVVSLQNIAWFQPRRWRHSMHFYLPRQMGLTDCSVFQVLICFKSKKEKSRTLVLSLVLDVPIPHFCLAIHFNRR